MTRLAALLATAISLAAATADPSPGQCAPCHAAQTAGFPHAAMTRALEAAKDCEILKANPKLTAKIGRYSYQIERLGDESIYTVSDGKDSIRVPLLWAFGLGSAGQTYAFERDGLWYESTVSYFSALHGLDLTLGAENQSGHNLEEAAGRQRPPVEIGECFSCHATNAVKTQQLTLSSMTAGVQCERCHGESERHLTAVRSGNAKEAGMRKLGALSAEEMSDFCGQCHRTWSQIAANGPHSVFNVRFQPYRLTNSKCYDTDDRRIRCTACHDPHREVATSPAAYDSKCTACHSHGASPVTKASYRICRIAAKGCVNCHMPRVEIPGSHYKFTDHWVRIVRKDDKYPD